MFVRYLGERPPVHVSAPDVNVSPIHYPERGMQSSSGKSCHINKMNFCIWTLWDRETGGESCGNAPSGQGASDRHWGKAGRRTGSPYVNTFTVLWPSSWRLAHMMKVVGPSWWRCWMGLRCENEPSSVNQNTHWNSSPLKTSLRTENGWIAGSYNSSFGKVTVAYQIAFMKWKCDSLSLCAAKVFSSAELVRLLAIFSFIPRELRPSSLWNNSWPWGGGEGCSALLSLSSASRCPLKRPMPIAFAL